MRAFINIAINSMTAKLYIFKGKVGMRAFAFLFVVFLQVNCYSKADLYLDKQRGRV